MLCVPCMTGMQPFVMCHFAQSITAAQLALISFQLGASGYASFLPVGIPGCVCAALPVWVPHPPTPQAEGGATPPAPPHQGQPCAACLQHGREVTRHRHHMHRGRSRRRMFKHRLRGKHIMYDMHAQHTMWQQQVWLLPAWGYSHMLETWCSSVHTRKQLLACFGCVQA
jgi:hypothetical protein